MITKSLYQITQEQGMLIAQIEESEGVLTPEMEEALAIQKNELEMKSLAYLEIINRKEQYVNAIDVEIKRLNGLKKQSEGVVSKLKETLLNAVKMFGEFEVGTHKFGIRKSEGTIVEDVNALPKEYKTVTVVEKADLNAIKKAIKMGETIKGCSIEERDNLSIK